MSCRETLMLGAGTVYYADIGEAMPDVDAAPGGGWTLIGTLGARDYDEAGISILSDVNTSDINSLGALRPECVVPTDIDLRVTLSLMDMSTAQLAVAFGFNTVAAEAGPPAVNRLSLNMPDNFVAKALLVRFDGKSPDFQTGSAQYEFSNCIELGSKDINYNKESAAMAALEFKILAGDADFVAQSA